MQQRKRVAIIGSGCSGIGALWALKCTNHEVHIYEKENRLGGHTNTVKWKHGDRTTNVDTGFIVLNSATYRTPHRNPKAKSCMAYIICSQLYQFLKRAQRPQISQLHDLWSITRCRSV